MSPEPEKRSDEEVWARLAEAATPGPWGAADEHGNWPGAAPAWCVSRMDADSGKWLHDVAYHASQSDGEQARRDSEFMAAARTAVPSLLAALAASRAEVESLNRQLDTPPWTLLDAARVEVSQLRAGIDRVMALSETMRTSPSPIANAYARDLRGALGRRGDCNNPRNDNENWRNCTRRNCCDPEAVVRSAEPSGSTDE